MGYDFTGKSGQQINGVHVRAVDNNGVRFEGVLDEHGRVGALQVLSMAQADDGGSVVAGLSNNVKSVERVWDERCWAPISIKAVQPGDAIIVNGRTYPVCDVGMSDLGQFRDGYVFKSKMETLNGKYGDVSFPAAAVDGALSLKAGIVSPDGSGQGIYKGSDGNLWISDCCGNIVKVSKQNYRIISTNGMISPDAYPFVKTTDDARYDEDDDDND